MMSDMSIEIGNQENNELNPNGNCLGVALIDCCRLSERAIPDANLRHISSIAEAVNALRFTRTPRILLRKNAKLIEKIVKLLAAWRLGLKVVGTPALVDDDVVLCLRSVRQLYGLPRAEAHWVVVKIQSDKEAVLYDQLWDHVVEEHPQAKQASSADVLGQNGPSFVL
jgi:hypothetical protein